MESCHEEFFQELELRIETQKQTLQARDESIKKLLEMLQNKGMGEFGSLSNYVAVSTTCAANSRLHYYMCFR